MVDVSSIKNCPASLRGFSLGDGDSYQRFALGPAGIVSGAAAAVAVETGYGLPLVGGPLAFTACEILHQTGTDDAVLTTVPLAEVAASALERMTTPRAPWAGLSLQHPHIMGVLNVTPDSFSDGGQHATKEAAITCGIALLEAGASIIDVGGESTRPGADPVSPDQEAARVVPVVQTLAERGVRVSIDTRHASVMGAALAAGAMIVNDITALEGDGNSLAVVAASTAAVVLMHMQGEPRTMQAEPCYRCAPLDVFEFLSARLAACRQSGISEDRLCVDPGIGFGKTTAHNLEILSRLALFHQLGVPVLLGASRKSFIARLSRDEPANERLAGSLAAVIAGLGQGVQIFRVHDVAETLQAITVLRAIVG